MEVSIYKSANKIGIAKFNRFSYLNGTQIANTCFKMQ